MACESTDRLPAVDLAALVETAALQTRVDRKYVVARRDLPMLLAGLPHGSRVLEIEGRRELGYRSTYLDTPDRRSYLSSGRAQRTRWKVRNRTYLDTGDTWLETKTAGPRGRTVKQRITHLDLPDGALSQPGTAFVSGVIGSEAARELRPVLVTAYVRSTFLLPVDGARVTVDVELGWTSTVTGRDLDRPSLAVVETKTGSTPSAFDRVLWRAGHRPVRFSKYGVGMAALDPDLPHLKWHRALDRHLAITTSTTSPTRHHARSSR